MSGLISRENNDRMVWPNECDYGLPILMRFSAQPGLHDSYPPQHIVEVGEYHEEEEDGHPDILRTEEELVARFAACDNLVKQEQDMSAVKGWDREDIHEGEDEGEEGCHLPEQHPVP